MTTPTEEERKAAAELLKGEIAGLRGAWKFEWDRAEAAEKRLEEAEGLLELAIQYIGGHKTEYGEDCPRRECNEHNFRLITVLDKLRSFNPPAEGE